jgi:hypothetical protein
VFEGGDGVGAEEVLGGGGAGEEGVEVLAVRDEGAQGIGELALGAPRRAQEEHVLAGYEAEQEAAHLLVAFQEASVEARFRVEEGLARARGPRARRCLD